MESSNRFQGLFLLLVMSVVSTLNMSTNLMSQEPNDSDYIVYFREDFESTSWIDNWDDVNSVILVANPVHSGVRAARFVTYYQNPRLSKSLSSSVTGTAVIWFYDNMGTVRESVGPMVTVLQDKLTLSSLGIAYEPRVTSDNYYVFGDGSAYKETDVPRSLGWHEFKFVVTDIGTGAYVDNKPLGQNTSMIEIKLLKLESHDIDAYFDDIEINSLADKENLPDLIVTDIWNGDNTIRYRVKNVGSVLAPAGHYAVLFVDGDFKVNDSVAADLAPGESCTGIFDYLWQCGAVEDNIVVKADYDGRMFEFNEVNNDREERWRCDTTPPAIIDGPILQYITQSSATIYWETDEDSNGVVKYDKVAGRYGFEKVDLQPSIKHTMALISLEPSTVYHFVVQSGDAAGNVTESRDIIFETSASRDDEDPRVSIPDPCLCTGIVTIPALAFDNIGVKKVEFYLSDKLLFTDHSSPYQVRLDTSKYKNGSHTLRAKVYDLAGRYSERERVIDFFNPLPDSNLPSVEIISPEDGDTVWGVIDIEVEASDPPPVGTIPPILQPVNRVEFYIDGVYMATGYPTIYRATYSWNTLSVGNGEHTITATAYDNADNSASDSIIVRVEQPPPPEPVVVVTRPRVTRHRTGLLITFELVNTGDETAYNIDLMERVRSFQVLPRIWCGLDGPWEAITPTYDEATRESEIHIKISNLAPHASALRTYYIVPILFEDEATYFVGTYTRLIYYGPNNREYWEDLCMPATQVEINPGVYQNLTNAANYAIARADYLIVTNPSRLYDFYSADGVEVDNLLSTTAQLALCRQGVMGYLDSYDTAILDELIEPAGGWATKISPNFSSPGNGYLLILGETEIVPSWLISEPWMRHTIPITDHPYADTGGTGAPNLIVGRIIGDNPDLLIKPIRVSIGVYEELPGYGFDRSDALLVSGIDKPGIAQDSIVWTVNRAVDWLDDEFNVCNIDWKDYFLASSFPRNYEQHDGFAAGNVTGDGKDEIIIADISTGIIYIYNVEGTQLASFVRNFEEGDGFAVGDVGWDSLDEIIIGDKSEDKIYIYTPLSPGWVVYNFNRDFQSFDGLAVGDVTGDSKKEILIADRDDRIDIYNKDGLHLGGFDCDYEAHDGFASGNITGLEKDEIVIADRSENKIYIFDASGAEVVVPWLLEHGFQDGDGLTIGDVAELDFKEIIIANRDDRIDVYNEDGNTLTSKFYCTFEKYNGFAAGDVTGDENDEILIGDTDDFVGITDLAFHARMRQAFIDEAPNKDVIYFCDHGSTNTWTPALSTIHFPIDFGNTNPFAFCSACLTGNYEDEEDNDYCIAEAFFDSNTSVYIGSTQVSYAACNHLGPRKFFKRWTPSKTIGQALFEVECDVWATSNRSWRYWAREYNLYGDPKFGAVPTAASTPLAAIEPQSAPPSSFEVNVPDYNITTFDNIDFVEIPGGDILLIQDRSQVPYWPVSIDFPKGYEVQNVVLTGKSGLITDTGLNIPCTSMEMELLPPGTNNGPPSQNEGWFPDTDFSWVLTENPDGSAVLVIMVYPFQYNPLTTDARFYKNFSFDIQYSVSSVQITSLTTDKFEYEQGSTLFADIELDNTGKTRDVIVSAMIKQYGQDEIIDGLLLCTLEEFSGPASFHTQWDSNDFKPNYYSLEVTLKDTNGNILDKNTRMFRLGICSGEVTNFAAAPEYLQAGQDVEINLVFTNTGTVDITGNAVVKAFKADGTLIEKFYDDFNDLSPSGEVYFDHIWNVSDTTPCKIVGYVLYDSKSTGQQVIYLDKCGGGAFSGDVNLDCYIDLTDFALLASCWLDSPCSVGLWCDRVDIDDNGIIGPSDLSLLVNQWLWCNDPDSPSCDVYWK